MREVVLHYGIWLSPVFLGLFIAIFVLSPSRGYFVGAVATLGGCIVAGWILLRLGLQPWNPNTTGLALVLVTSAFCVALAAFLAGCMYFRFR
jgi:hypothetical protein